MAIDGKGDIIAQTTAPFQSLTGQQTVTRPFLDGGLIHPNRVIKAFISQMKIIDPDLLTHSRSVTRYSLLMARSLEFTPDDVRKVFYSSLLHDLGMITIDRQIIEKEGRLEPQEWQMIQRHPVNAEKILSAFPCFQDIIPIIRHHHERYNGMGYPDGLKGEGIPFISRVISVADVFDAITHSRPYRKAQGIEEAVRIIEEDAGRQFDPRLTTLFVTVIFEDLKRRRAHEEERSQWFHMAHE